jgi:putative peptidoglycan lipid II flippase
MAGPLSLGLLGIAAGQLNSALDPLFAIWADAEGPAYLFYAIRIQQLPLALFGIALSGALLPAISRAVKRGETKECRTLLQSGLSQSLKLMIPCMAILLLLGPHMVAFLFARGNFSAVAVQGTSGCLLGYSFGLIPMTLVLVQAPACYAEGNYRVPSLLAVASVLVNIVLNALFVGVFGWGAESVAWATAISSWGNAFFLSRYLRSRWGSSASHYVSDLKKVMLLTLLGGGMSFFLANWVGYASREVVAGHWPAHFWTQLGLLALLLFPFVPARGEGRL